jgi:hypothetical protein
MEIYQFTKFLAKIFRAVKGKIFTALKPSNCW